jgi:hypothetical protein
MPDLEHRLEDLFMHDSKSRQVTSVAVPARRPSPFRGAAFVAVTALAAVALIVALNTLRSGPEVTTPLASPSTSASPTASPSTAPSAPASVSPAATSGPVASPSGTARPLAAGEWANAALNYAVTLPTPWRYSFEQSKVFPNDQATAAVDVYTYRPPGNEPVRDPDWKVKVVVSRNPARLTPAQWADMVGGATGPVASATVDGRPAVSRENTDGIDRQGASPPLFRHFYVADGVLMYDISAQQGCCVGPSTIQPTDPASIVQSFRFLGAASKSGTATIAGRVRYPSEFLPAQVVFAIDAKDRSRFYRVDTPQSSSQVWYRLADLSPGTYVIVAYTQETSPRTAGYAGGYTRYAACGLTAECAQDHTLVQVTVKANDYLMGIDPSDWYAPNGTYPARPE